MDFANVDIALDHAQRHNLQRLRELTAERRNFGLATACTYLRSRLTEEGWCRLRVNEALAPLVAKINSVRNTKTPDCIDGGTGKCRLVCAIPNNILANRHEEITDPDKEISRELHCRGLVDPVVQEAFDSVSDLLPNDPMGDARHVRSGLVVNSASDKSKSAARSCKNARELYWKYVYSAEYSVPTNNLSKMYNTKYTVMGIEIKASKSLQHFLDSEKNKGATNYVRGLTVAYLVSSSFGIAFAGMQAYQRGCALAASTKLAETPTEVRKKVLARKLPTPGARIRYPVCDLVGGANVDSNPLDTEEYLAKLVEFELRDKDALARMTTPFAETSPDGILAKWLVANTSELLGRPVTVQYAQLLLANWAARHPSRKDFLSQFASIFGVVFDKTSGLVLPIAGFGSGLTRKRLEVYVARLLLHGLGPLMKKQSLPPTLQVMPQSLEDVADGFFKSGDDENDDQAAAAANDSCKCSCHVESSLVGMVFHPCPSRRAIKEKVYARALSAEPVLSFTFGKCGYQHPLSTNSDPSTQRIKERLLFDQWNAAIAINHLNLVQFLLSGAETEAGKIARARLVSMTKPSLARLAKGVRNMPAMTRIVENMCIKFNSYMFTQARCNDRFLRARAGLQVQQHATEIWNTALGRTTPPPLKVLEVARTCLCDGDEAGDQEDGGGGVIKTAMHRAWRCPFEGLSVVYPDHYVDEKATLCGQPTFGFWLEKLNDEGCQSTAATTFKCKGGGLPLNSKKPWSPKNTGQAGRKTTELSPNSIIAVTGKDISLFFVEDRRAKPFTPREKNIAGRIFVAASDISPMYQDVGKFSFLLTPINR